VLKNDVAHGLTVRPPNRRNRDKLTMRAKPLKTRDLILSLSKDEAKISCLFSSLLALSFRNDAKVRPEKCEAVFR
jgi:hypothetical protein